MKTLLKIILAPFAFLLWILVVIITMKERNEYLMAQSRGMDCIESKDVSVFIPGHTTEFRYDPTKKPTKRYPTWRQFWTRMGYYKKQEA